MIEFVELREGDNIHAVFREDGSFKVVRMVFMGWAPSRNYDCDTIVICRTDTKQAHEVDDPFVLFRTKEEAEQLAVALIFRLSPGR